MKQYKARDKITQKMTRDGAIEVNAATGKQKRISKRAREAALLKTPEQQAAQDAYACYECFYPLGSYPLLRRKSDFAKLPQKKNAAISKKITTLSKSCSVLSRTFLFALFFDFGNLFCRCGHNPYACIAHTVKERVKLPPLCVLCSGRV